MPPTVKERLAGAIWMYRHYKRRANESWDNFGEDIHKKWVVWDYNITMAETYKACILILLEQ